MRWLEPFYHGDIDEDAIPAMKEEAEGFDPKEYGEYKIIILSLNPQNMFEILSFHQLTIPYYQTCDFKVVGLAKDKADAEKVICHIIEDVYSQQGDYDVKRFFA